MADLNELLQLFSLLGMGQGMQRNQQMGAIEPMQAMMDMQRGQAGIGLDAMQTMQRQQEADRAYSLSQQQLAQQQPEADQNQLNYLNQLFQQSLQPGMMDALQSRGIDTTGMPRQLTVDELVMILQAKKKPETLTPELQELARIHGHI